MHDQYITPLETIVLLGWLVGPELFLGLVGQLYFYKYKNLFLLEKKWILYGSLFISTALTLVMSILLWVNFPALAPPPFFEDGGVKPLFMPAIISSFIIFPLTSIAVLHICKKKYDKIKTRYIFLLLCTSQISYTAYLWGRALWLFYKQSLEDRPFIFLQESPIFIYFGFFILIQSAYKFIEDKEKNKIEAVFNIASNVAFALYCVGLGTYFFDIIVR